MVYDIWGSWDKTVGPNAPLNDTCAPSAYQEGSAVSAIQAWTSAKLPAHQIVLGVASYGYSFFVPRSIAMTSNGGIAAYPAFNASLQPSGDKWDDAAGVDQCGNPTSVGGIFDFWGLVDGGFLNTDGEVAKGIQYRYDSCSQTVSYFIKWPSIIHSLILVQPYVYNTTSQVMISYDDATSFGRIDSLFGEIMISQTTIVSRERSIYPQHAAEGICPVAGWR
jgi:chitinase